MKKIWIKPRGIFIKKIPYNFHCRGALIKSFDLSFAFKEMNVTIFRQILNTLPL
jgi:hypothetical protein